MNELLCIEGHTLVVRPIAITDADRLARMFTRLSPTTVHFRFFSPIRRVPRGALVRLADVDHQRRDALVALDGDEIVAVARYDAQPGATEAEIALTVEDAWQHRGLGEALALRLGVLARRRGYERFTATVLPDNRAALGLMRKLSPAARVRFAGGEYEASVPLTRAG
jgi:RimJ/RimL family protein N-acetyltransferase